MRSFPQGLSSSTYVPICIVQNVSAVQYVRYVCLATGFGGCTLSRPPTQRLSSHVTGGKMQLRGKGGGSWRGDEKKGDIYEEAQSRGRLRNESYFWRSGGRILLIFSPAADHPATHTCKVLCSWCFNTNYKRAQHVDSSIISSSMIGNLFSMQCHLP